MDLEIKKAMGGEAKRKKSFSLFTTFLSMQVVDGEDQIGLMGKTYFR